MLISGPVAQPDRNSLAVDFDVFALVCHEFDGWRLILPPLETFLTPGSVSHTLEGVLKSHPASRHSEYCHIVSDVFTLVLAKHTKHMSLVDILSVGVDRMQRNFEPMRKQVEAWKATRIPNEAAKLIIYRAFVEGQLDVPKHLARRVHDLDFNPQIEEFAPRTTWSLSNAFTSAFKELDSIPQFKSTAKLASFLEVATAALS